MAVRPDPAAPALLEEERGQVEMPPLAGLAVQLDQRHLDLGVAVGRLAPARPEHRVDVVNEARGDGQQPLVAGVATKRQRRLDQVPERSRARGRA